MKNSRFKPQHHIPRFSSLLARAIFDPLLIYFAIAGNLLTLIGAGIFYYLESPINPNVKTIWDAYWWAMCTVSTVGYGDIVPTTGGGRIIAVFLIITGVTFFLGYMAILVTSMSALIAEEQAAE